MPPAFDAYAPTYDKNFTSSLIARELRARVHARLDRHFAAGQHVLELGCGTGEDALHLAERGVRVTATDASAAMLDAAREKMKDFEPPRRQDRQEDGAWLSQAPTEAQRWSPSSSTGSGIDAADNPLVQFSLLDLNRLPDEFAAFDGAFGNFGVINCCADWRGLAAWLAKRLPVGGMAGFGVMSPACVWEMGWHGLHGDFGTAFRRWRKDTAFEGMPIHYPTIRRITDDFAPHFRRVHVEPLGLCLPPSDVYGVIERRKRLLRTLTAWDRGLSRVRRLALFADHYWIEFERRA